MSRIGNSPVSFSEGTTVSLVDGIVTVKGKLGEFSGAGLALQAPRDHRYGHRLHP